MARWEKENKRNICDCRHIIYKFLCSISCDKKLCHFVFIYFIGATGAALATLLGYAVTWVLRTKYLQSFIKMKVNWFNHFASLFLVAIQAIIATINISLIIQIVFFLAVLILNRKFITLVVNKIIKRGF